MITYKDLREKVQKLEKLPGCVKIERSPLINRGFPGMFNYSFTEFPWLEEFDRYINFDRDYIFSTIQSVIRDDDLFGRKGKNAKLPKVIGENSWKSLGVFEMTDICGQAVLKDGSNALDFHKMQANKIIELFTSLGIKKNQIYPTYCPGGKVSELSGGMYKFDFYIPEDDFGKEIFLEQGIPKENIIPDASRNTLLCLALKAQNRIGEPAKTIMSPWGYRNEVDINIGTNENPKLVDTGTLERLIYNPVYREGVQNLENKQDVISLAEAKSGVSVGGIGLERLCMIANRLQNIRDVDYLKLFYSTMPKTVGIQAGECLRALHRVYSDVNKYNLPLSKKRHKEIRKQIIRPILDSNLSEQEMRNLLETHTETQPWHPELKDGIELTIANIHNYSERRKRK